jgi:hypothetical protein
VHCLKPPAKVIHPEMRAKQTDREEKIVVEITLLNHKQNQNDRLNCLHLNCLIKILNVIEMFASRFASFGESYIGLVGL